MTDTLADEYTGVRLIPGADERESKARAREIKWRVGQLYQDVRKHIAALAELDALPDRVAMTELYSKGSGRLLSRDEYVDWLTCVMIEGGDDHIEGGV